MNLKNNIKNSLYAPSNFFAAIISAAVGYASSSILVYNSALHMGATPAIASSWLGTVCLGMGILTILLTLYYKVPIMFAWSTAGAALILTYPNDIPLSDVYGTFAFSSALIILFSATGIFEKIMNKIPLALSHAMLAGVLLKFVLSAFMYQDGQLSFTLMLFFLYLFSRHFFPKTSIILLATLGLIIAILFYDYKIPSFDLALTHFTFIAPTFNPKALIGLGIPLFVVIMTSQNMAGIATLKAYDYPIKITPVLTWSGVTNFITSFFGAFSINLSAITAAICMTPEAHPDKNKRYGAALYLGVIYIILGFFAESVGIIFQSLPKTLIQSVTGFALLGTVVNGLTNVIQDKNHVHASMLTFFITASGVSILGIGSAFWGISVGVFVYFFLKQKPNT